MTQIQRTENQIGNDLTNFDVELYGARLFFKFYCIFFGIIFLFLTTTTLIGISNGFGPRILMISVYIIGPSLIFVPLLILARLTGKHLGRIVAISRSKFYWWIPAFSIIMSLSVLIMMFFTFLLGHIIGINPNKEGLNSSIYMIELPLFVMSIFIFTFINFILSDHILNKQKHAEKHPHEPNPSFNPDAASARQRPILPRRHGSAG